MIEVNITSNEKSQHYLPPDIWKEHITTAVVFCQKGISESNHNEASGKPVEEQSTK